MSLLTPSEARDLTFRAAGILERRDMLRGAAVPDDDGERIGPLIKTWLQAFAPAQPDALERRLAWDGLTSEDLHHITADARVVAGLVPAAGWTSWISDVLEVLPDVARDVVAAPETFDERRLFDGAAEPPFLEVLSACARAATARLTRTTPAWSEAAPGVRDALTRQLLSDLGGVSDLSLYAQLQAWRATPHANRGGDGVYAAFVRHLLRGGLLEFWQGYPVLARQMATVATTWVTATEELLTRGAADHAQLEATFGPLGQMTGITPGLSDPHDGRRRVAIVRFASGRALVYKPRDVRLEAAWAALLGWAHGAGLTPPQPIVAVLAGDGYGWSAVATRDDFASTAQVEHYYRVAGGLVALAYVLRARDLQMENIVATLAGPAVIDVEMFCQPTRDLDVDADGRPRPESCLASGLLSMAHVGPADAVFDIGGLRGDGVTPTSLARRTWRGQGTDALGYTEERVVTDPTPNRVLRDGTLQDPAAHRSALLDGFTTTYEFLRAQQAALVAADGPLAPFAAAATRVLFRPSQHYGSVQYALAAPAYQTSGTLRGCAIDTLNRVFNLDETVPSLWPVIADERRALDALDLPRYAVDVTGTGVRSATGDLAVNYFSRSGLDGVHDVLASLSTADRARQSALLDQALTNGVGVRLITELTTQPAAPQPLAPWLHGEAVALGAELARRGRRAATDALDWPLVDTMPGRWAAHVLYDGTLGAAVFLAALARVTGDVRTGADAHAAAAGLCALVASDPEQALEEVGVGGCTGVGSLVYGLSLLARLTGRDTYRAAAARLAGTLTPDVAARDRVFDVTGGAAGTVLALLALHGLDGDARGLDAARAFGDRLCQSQVPQGAGAGWPTRRGQPIAGFAHGSAGIALALDRLADALGDARYRQAAARAITHERACFVPALGNWPVRGALDPATGSGHSSMTAWCHGAAGIGLARVVATGDRDETTMAEMAAARAAISRTTLTALDQVCCGNLGRADMLLSFGEHLGDAEIVDDGVALAARAADRAARRQLYGLRASGVDYRVFDPGFFRGLSGIGYTLLRAAHPGVLPSVLAFESSVRGADAA